MFEKAKSAIYNGLEDYKSEEFTPVQIFLSSVTVISITSIILETLQSLNNLSPIFLAIEWFASLIFTIEYLSRIYIIENKLKYIFSFWGAIDLVSILPTFLSLGNWTFLKSSRMLRVLRLARIFRMAKISRAYLSTRNEAKTQANINKINSVIYFLAISTATILFGSILYVAEHPSQAYVDIPASMLQVVKILIGGVGYAPTGTPVGEIIVVVIRFIGLALFGLMISIISGILNQWLLGEERKEK